MTGDGEGEYFVIPRGGAASYPTFRDAVAARDAVENGRGDRFVIARAVRTRLVEVVPHGASPDGTVSGAALRALIAERARGRGEFHYRDLLREIEDEGHVVGGADPVATFLTQLTRVEGIERAGGNRSGKYAWRGAE